MRLRRCGGFHAPGHTTLCLVGASFASACLRGGSTGRAPRPGKRNRTRSWRAWQSSGRAHSRIARSGTLVRIRRHRAPCRRAFQATLHPRATGHDNHRSNSTVLLRPGMAVRSDASVEPSVDRSPCSNTTIATFVGPVRSREFGNSRTRTGHASRASDSRAARGWRSRAAECPPTTRKHACFRAAPLAAGPDSVRIAAHDAYPSQTAHK